MADGLANKEIATALGLGDGTVRNYLTSVFTKLEVRNRTETVTLWLRSGDNAANPQGKG